MEVQRQRDKGMEIGKGVFGSQQISVAEVKCPCGKPLESWKPLECYVRARMLKTLPSCFYCLFFPRAENKMIYQNGVVEMEKHIRITERNFVNRW